MDLRDPARPARMRTLIRIAALGLYASVALIAYLAWLSKTGTQLGEAVWLAVGGLTQTFGGCLITAYNFEFGSSAGSQAKDVRLPPASDPENPP